jgi:hypothetical protein
VFDVSKVEGLTLEEQICDVKRKLFPLRVTSFDCKSFTKQSSRTSKKDSFYMEVKMFLGDLDVMKTYSFEGGFNFREYENINLCIVR